MDTCFSNATAGEAALTVKVFEAVLPVPPFVEDTAPLVLAKLPTFGAVTLTDMVQVPPAVMVPLVNDMDVAVATGVKVGVPHPLVVAFGVAATRICAGDVGKVSVNARPVNESFWFGLVIVKVNLDAAPARIGLGENNFVMPGGCKTVREAVALPVEPAFVPPFVEEIKPLTFWCDPEVVPVILTFTVHELFAGMDAPVGDPKVRAAAAAAGAQVGVPPQVVDAEGVAATCKPEGSESVNVAPINAIEFEFESVKVSVDVPLIAMGLDEKVLVIVGGLGTAQPVKVTSSKYMSEPETELPALYA